MKCTTSSWCNGTKALIHGAKNLRRAKLQPVFKVNYLHLPGSVRCWEAILHVPHTSLHNVWKHELPFCPRLSFKDVCIMNKALETEQESHSRAKVRQVYCLLKTSEFPKLKVPRLQHKPTAVSPWSSSLSTLKGLRLGVNLQEVGRIIKLDVPQKRPLSQTQESPALCQHPSNRGRLTW